MSSIEVPEEQQTIKPLAKNKQRIRLLFPYSENAEVKKLGARWNTEMKHWYFPSLDGELPDGLKKYRACFLDIEYDEKEYYKTVLPSMRYHSIEKKWYVNQEDFNKVSS